MKPKAWTRYKTKCGFEAEVYRSIESTNNYFAMGGILITGNSAAAFLGWTPVKWDPNTGKCTDREEYDGWDLVEEIGGLIICNCGK